MARAWCGEHPDQIARRTPCRRCGSFVCEECFAHPDHDLCPACSEKTGELAADLALPERQRQQRRWMRKNPRLAGLAFMGGGLGLATLNVVMLVAMERYYVIMFPLGGALFGLGLSALLTGRVVVQRFSDAPLSYWIVTGGLAGGCMIAGFGLNFLL